MTESEEVKRRLRRTRQEVQRLVSEFGTSGLPRSEFCRIRPFSFCQIKSGCRALSHQLRLSLLLLCARPLAGSARLTIRRFHSLVLRAISSLCFGRLSVGVLTRRRCEI